MGRVLLATIAAAGVLLGTSAAAAAGIVEGEVAGSAGQFLLVRSGSAEIVVRVERGAVLVGVDDLGQLRDGDRVRIAASAERNGVRSADRVETAAPVGTVAVRSVVAEAVPTGPDRPAIVDVRSPAAFAAGHLPGAISAPPDRLKELDRLVPSSGRNGALFCGTRRLAPELIAAVRKAYALGWQEIAWVTGGVPAWEDAGRPLFVTPDAVAAGLGVPTTILDIRERDRAAAGTIPGAFSVPRSAWRWQQFADGRTLPTIVLVGEGGDHAAVLEAAEQLRLWAAGALARHAPRIRILEGGFEAWARSGRKVAPAVPGDVVWALGPAEISLDEFRGPFQADPGPSGPFLVDVSGDRVAPPWGKSIPLGELPERVGELPRDREILLFCRMGKQAEIGRAILAKNGFRVRFLNGPTP